MEAATSTAADLATATAPTASATSTSLAADFSWLSISEVFWITVLYVWYMFLFMACFAIVVGGIWLVGLALVMIFQLLTQHGPGIYSNSRERLEKYWEASKDRYATRHNGGRTRNQPDSVQMSGLEENDVRSMFGRETV